MKTPTMTKPRTHLARLNKPHILLRYDTRRSILERRIYPTYALAMIRVHKLPRDASVLIVRECKVTFQQGDHLPCNVLFAARSAHRWYTTVAKKIASSRSRKAWFKRHRHLLRHIRSSDHQNSSPPTKETNDADQGV